MGFIWRRTWKSKWTEAVTKLGRLWHCTSWSSWRAFIVGSSHVQECNRLVVCCSSTWLLHLADCWPDCDATRRLWGSRFRTASHRSRPPGPSPPLIPNQLTSTRSSDHSTTLYRKLLTHPTMWICGFVYFCISFELFFIHFCQFPSLPDNFHSSHRFLFHSIVPSTIPPHHSTSPLLSNG